MKEFAANRNLELMGRWISSVALLLSVNQVAVGQAFLKEQVGELKIEEIILQPRLSLVEGGEGEINLESAAVGFLWRMDEDLSARIKIGSLSLLNRPQIFTSDSSIDDSIGFYEAYGQFKSLYGEVKFGLIPIGFGWNGALGEADIILPRPQFMQHRWVSLRDYGASYEINYNGYFTRAAVHNGEGIDENVDNQTWLTSTFGWQDGQSFFVGLSGQTGQSEQESTSATAVDDFTGFDNSRWAKWRTGSLFTAIKNKGFGTVLEMVVGERVQLDPADSKEEDLERFYAGYWDVNFDVTERSVVWFRFDVLDPSKKDDEDQVREISLGVSMQNEYKTSTVLALFTKQIEEPKDEPNDRFIISWKIRPYF